MKRGRAVFVIIALFLAISGCSDSDPSRAKATSYAPTYSSSDTWLVYWYVRGSDLETESGAASADIEELRRVSLPPNVRVLIQTGGAKVWQTSEISANGIGRFIFDSDGFRKLQTNPDANMGDISTLADFLRYGRDNFDADHRVFVFWDHGGGSALGLCFDEKYRSLLSLNDVHNAFSDVYGMNTDDPPFELVGFDACLMATIESAASLHGIARYMVGSEEMEPGLGWRYDGWIGALAENPGIGGADLGRAICDSYIAACANENVEDEVTLSVTDVTRTPQILEAYGAFGAEALRRANANPREFFTNLARRAESSENFGGNTREQGYSDMIDLGHLAQSLSTDMPKTAPALSAAVRDAVIYQVKGDYRPGASGLSSFYSFDGDADIWQRYANLDAPPLSVKCLYYYLLFGEIPDEAQPFLTGEAMPQVSASPAPGSPEGSSGSAASGSIADALLGNTAPPAAGAHPVFSIGTLEDTPVAIDNEGAAFVSLTREQMDLLSAVHCQFFYIGEEEDVILYLGSDADIIADWDTGIFKDNFSGRWPMLDGHPIYIEIIYEGDDYYRYSVPVKLNGTESNLQVIYSCKDEKYKILGARRGIDNNGMADRDLVKLKAGDRITTLHYTMTITGNDTDFTQHEIDTFTIGESPKISDEDVGDGKYGYYFEFVDPLNNSALSNQVTYTIANGEIVTSVGDASVETGYGTDDSPAGSSIADRLTGGGSYSATIQSGGSIADSLR